jgi:hypothetical protein
MMMQLRISGVGVSAEPTAPKAPVKLLGSFSGSLISPRFTRKMRSGLSANTPPCEPNA